VKCDGERLEALIAVKGFTSQHVLAALAGVSQPTISEMLKGKTSETSFFKVANALDCEADFLHVRGRYKSPINLTEGSVELRRVASDMAFVFFENDAPDQHVTWCRNVLGHKAAPITALGWRYLGEQIALAMDAPRPGGDVVEFVRPQSKR